MLKKLLIILLLFTLNILFASSSQNKIALLIGNNNYIEHTKLNNTINDVNLLESTLKKRGFEVIKVTDATTSIMKKKLKSFTKMLDIDSVALFYYAGHGVEVDGQNYLLGIDSKIEEYTEVKYNAVSLNHVTSIMKKSNNNLNIIILDACRDNPFNKNKKGGLAPYTNTPGFFVAYATQAGHVAIDGEKDGNGIFTKYLVDNIKLTGIDIEDVFKRTREDVYKYTNAQQHPATYSSILGNFYFTELSKTTRGLKVTKRDRNRVFLKKHKRFIEPHMVLIKKGTYIKGDNENFETSPEHKVNIIKEFYISTHEITFKEFDLFSKDTGWYSPSDNSWGRGMQPVINVNWNDANKYCEWLSKKTKKKYKLPTESQWEYVAKAKQNFIYGVSNDDTLLSKYAWYDENSKEHTYLVGRKQINQFGAYDILGNVQEWTQDDFIQYTNKTYKDNYRNAQAIITRNSFEKVVKGGSWYSEYSELRVANRISLDKSSRNSSTGFRIVMVK